MELRLDIHLVPSVSVASSILTDASRPAGTEPALDPPAETLRRVVAGMGTFGDGTDGDSAITVSRSSVDMTDKLSFVPRFAFLDGFPEDATLDIGVLTLSASLEARRAVKRFRWPSSESTSPSEEPSTDAMISSQILIFSLLNFMSSSSNSRAVSSPEAESISSVRHKPCNVCWEGDGVGTELMESR